MTELNILTIKSIFNDDGTQYQTTNDIITDKGESGKSYDLIEYVVDSNNDSKNFEIISQNFTITCNFHIKKQLTIKSGATVHVNSGGKIICDSNIYIQNQSRIIEIDKYNKEYVKIVEAGCLSIEENGTLQMNNQYTIFSDKGRDEYYDLIKNNELEQCGSLVFDGGTVIYNKSNLILWNIYCDFKDIIINCNTGDTITFNNSYVVVNKIRDNNNILNNSKLQITFNNCIINVKINETTETKNGGANSNTINPLNTFQNITLNYSVLEISQDSSNNSAIYFKKLESNDSIFSYDAQSNLFIMNHPDSTANSIIGNTFCNSKIIIKNCPNFEFHSVHVYGNGTFNCYNTTLNINYTEDKYFPNLYVETPSLLEKSIIKITETKEGMPEFYKYISFHTIGFMGINSSIQNENNLTQNDTVECKSNYSPVSNNGDNNDDYPIDGGLYFLYDNIINNICDQIGVNMTNINANKTQINNLRNKVGIDEEGEETQDTNTLIYELKTLDKSISNNNIDINTNKTQIGYLKNIVGIDDKGEPTSENTTIINRLKTIQNYIGITDDGKNDTETDGLVDIVENIINKIGINDKGEQQFGDSYKTSILNRLDRTESNIGIDVEGDKVGSTAVNDTENMLSRLKNIQETIGINNLGEVVNNSDIIRNKFGEIYENNSMIHVVDLIYSKIYNSENGLVKSVDTLQNNVDNLNTVAKGHEIRISNNENSISNLNTVAKGHETRISNNENSISNLNTVAKGHETRISNNETQIGYLKYTVGIDNDGKQLFGDDYNMTILNRLDITEDDIDKLSNYLNIISEVLDVDEVKKLLEQKNYDFDDVFNQILNIIETRDFDLRRINVKMLLLSILSNKQKYSNT